MTRVVNTGATEAKSTSAAGRVPPDAGRGGERQAAVRFDDQVLIGGGQMDVARLEVVAGRRILHGQRGEAIEHGRQEARLLRMPMLDDRDGAGKSAGNAPKIWPNAWIPPAEAASTTTGNAGLGGVGGGAWGVIMLSSAAG